MDFINIGKKLARISISVGTYLLSPMAYLTVLVRKTSVKTEKVPLNDAQQVTCVSLFHFQCNYDL